MVRFSPFLIVSQLLCSLPQWEREITIRQELLPRKLKIIVVGIGGTQNRYFQSLISQKTLLDHSRGESFRVNAYYRVHAPILITVIKSGVRLVLVSLRTLLSILVSVDAITVMFNIVQVRLMQRLTMTNVLVNQNTPLLYMRPRISITWCFVKLSKNALHVFSFGTSVWLHSASTKRVIQTLS